MLILPGSPAFAHCVDNILSSSGPGTTFSTGVSNADGSVVQLLSALAFDVHFIVVALGGSGVTAAATHALADIMVDPAGGTSWSEFIDSLIFGFASIPSGTIPLVHTYMFPVFIKAGSTVGVRARYAHSVAQPNTKCAIWAYGTPRRPDVFWCGSGVESLGINAGTSKGTNVTPGVSNAFGSWATIGTSTARYGAIQYGVQGADSGMVSASYVFEIGAGSSRLAGSPSIYLQCTNAEVLAITGGWQPIPCDTPPSTAFQARGACQGGSAEVFDVGIYGVY